ncbi:MAG: carboxypeptidase-like regulatory domain-containing protein [Dysgonamonadaceae bacterium]|jgi:hypothetical protein|nr:carboxypeptidase-like regulatory domain-containing protein [Dysgonamonadaceae bacterium]
MMQHLFKLLLFFFLPVLFPVTVCSQSFSISGKVVEQQTHTPMARVQIKIRKITENQILAFSQTDNNGNFKIEKKLSPDSLVLEVSCIGYATQQKMLADVSKPLFIEMEVKETQLKEVVVKPKKIGLQGDTVKYLVSSFATANDRTIGDVLKKMPGIEVMESGEIKYQGKSLNKFYIEGSDLLGGRYGLATNNISHKDVAGVEVMENHQPVKAVQDLVFSDNPAINIKLKNDAKSRWVGTAKAGIGIPQLWKGEAFAMRFKAKTQSFNTYKGNNTGELINDAMVFTSVGDFQVTNSNTLPEYIRVSPTLVRSIGANRSHFNRTNNLSSNNLFKVGKDYDLVSEIVSSVNNQESEFSSKTTYFLDDEIVSFEEKNERAESRKKILDGKISLKGNKNKFYLNNNLRFNLLFDDIDMGVSGTFPNTQMASKDKKKFSNDFDLLQRFGNKTVSFNSKMEYAFTPQSLKITNEDGKTEYQDIDFSSFYTNNSADFSFLLGNFLIDTKGGFLYLNHDIKNTWNENPEQTEYTKFQPYITPSVQYGSQSFKIRLNFPIQYQHYSISDKKYGIFSVTPNIYFDWIANSRITLNANASIGKIMPDEDLFYTESIMNNYRNLSLGYIDFATGKSYQYGIGLKYKDILKALFADANIIFSGSEQKKVSGQNFSENKIINQYIHGISKRDALLIGGSVSKGIDVLNGILALYPSYTRQESKVRRNETDMPYESTIYSLRGKITANKLSWCTIDYGIGYTHSKSEVAGIQSITNNYLSESLNVVFIIAKPLQLKFNFDHYCNELSRNKFKNFFFTDLSSSYLLNDRFEISMVAKNIFNETTYSYFNEDELITIYNEYKIRPFNLLACLSYRF